MYHLTLSQGVPALIARHAIPLARGIAVTDFRTLPNGSYRYMRDLTRGYWRVLELRDVDGPRNVNSHNVISVIWEGHKGIDGTTERSKYYLGNSYAKAKMFASRFNNHGSI